MEHRTIILPLALLILMGIVTESGAEPSWTDQGVPVCTDLNAQDEVALSTGGGLAVVVWRDNRNGEFDLYGQALDLDGNRVWIPEQGIPISTATGRQEEPALAIGPDGLAWAAWRDTRPCAQADGSIFLQGLDETAVAQCAPDGIRVISDPPCAGTEGYRSHHPTVLAPGIGKAIVAWNRRNQVFGGHNADVQAQAIDGSCALLWGSTGTQVYRQAWTGVPEIYPHLISDGAGGILAVWGDPFQPVNVGGGRVYVRRVDSGGQALWGTWVGVSTVNANQNAPAAASDGAGGVIVVWENGSAGSRTIRGQRISADGLRSWGDGGKVIAGGPGDLRSPQIVRASSGRSWVLWEQDLGGTDQDLYAQRISFLGDTLGPRLPVCTGPLTQTALRAVGAGSALCIAVWEDRRDEPNGDPGEIYAQKLGIEGLLNGR